ncbi:MAG: phytoene/squalene synthase family protein, partial [Thermoactinomyces sp.]
KKSFSDNELMDVFNPYKSLLPEVTLRMGDWTKLSPSSIKSNIYRATANMAEGMADWVSKGWRMKTEEDLDQYTFTVAGLVGLLLTELWMWYDATETDRNQLGLTGSQYH